MVAIVTFVLGIVILAGVATYIDVRLGYRKSDRLIREWRGAYKKEMARYEDEGGE